MSGDASDAKSAIALRPRKGAPRMGMAFDVAAVVSAAPAPLAQAQFTTQAPLVADAAAIPDHDASPAEPPDAPVVADAIVEPVTARPTAKRGAAIRPDKSVHFRLPAATRTALFIHARRAGTTVQALMSDAVDRILAE